MALFWDFALVMLLLMLLTKVKVGSQQTIGGIMAFFLCGMVRESSQHGNRSQNLLRGSNKQRGILWWISDRKVGVCKDISKRLVLASKNWSA